MATNEPSRSNQLMFRDANERLQGAVDGRIPTGSILPFLCECADRDCRGTIELGGFDYDAVHVDRNQYVVLFGHTLIEGEEVVEDDDSYLVVRKAAVA